MKKNHLAGICAVLVAVVALAAGAYSQDKKEAAPTHKILHYGDLKWTPIIKGCDLATVSGDPSAEGGSFVVRIRCADGGKIPAHWHPNDENVTVLKGTFLVGMGESFVHGAGPFKVNWVNPSEVIPPDAPAAAPAKPKS